ncbi:hypothetical protein [Sphingomonas jatrophae]|uniref:Uncharacterized protein n=1 Tax=Sphingomonas jatrophae TaxID=1166337 RepID=A0A1I6JNW3_9SPHN|nr:hypothetical protein [Sphingomonas jatrophae]SFR80666.1 hypothetical protein SAMN05192580_0605 [Sphingomonas jatrophae]
MRNVADDRPVRLYRLDDDGFAQTVLYGSLAEASAAAAAMPVEDQQVLWLQTADDVIAWSDFHEG